MNSKLRTLALIIVLFNIMCNETIAQNHDKLYDKILNTDIPISKRINTLNKIKDSEVLFNLLIKTSPNDDIRDNILKRLQTWMHDDYFLNNINEIQNVELLIYVYKKSDKEGFREAAKRSLFIPRNHYDQNELIDLYNKTDDEIIKIGILKSINDQIALKELYEKTNNQRMRSFILKNINDQIALKELYEKTSNQRMRSLILKNINDQKYIIEKLENYSFGAYKGDVLNLINDKGFLINWYENKHYTGDTQDKKIIIGKLFYDELFLKKIVLNEERHELAYTAISYITNVSMLNELLMNLSSDERNSSQLQDDHFLDSKKKLISFQIFLLNDIVKNLGNISFSALNQCSSKAYTEISENNFVLPSNSSLGIGKRYILAKCLITIYLTVDNKGLDGCQVINFGNFDFPKKYRFTSDYESEFGQIDLTKLIGCVLNIFNQDQLEQLVLNSSSQYIVRLEALKKITNQQFLKQIVSQDDNIEIRKKAIDLIIPNGNQLFFKEIVNNEEDKACLRVALSKIIVAENIDFLKEIAKNHKLEYVREIAEEKLTSITDE
ncbi:hypothetical protein ACFLSE_08395 [Bacteroidota bacterium]